MRRRRRKRKRKWKRKRKRKRESARRKWNEGRLRERYTDITTTERVSTIGGHQVLLPQSPSCLYTPKEHRQRANSSISVAIHEAVYD